jgi:hypothetical protein
VKKMWLGFAGGLVVVVLAASPLVAQVNFNLTGAGSGGPNLDGVYTSPYTGTINGGPSVPVICDDFSDESYLPEQWTAYQTSLSTIVGGSGPSYLQWKDADSNGAVSAGGTSYAGWDLSQPLAYEAATVLSIDILQAAPGSTAQKVYSYALWELFDPYGSLPADPGVIPWLNGASGTVDTATLQAATADVEAAVNQVKGSGFNLSAYLNANNISSVTIYSYDAAGGPPTCSGGSCASSPPQEFISVTTPEASTPVLLAVDLLGLVALAGFLRKRIMARSI